MTTSGSGSAGETTPAEDAAWDAFVEANPRACYLQLSGWGRSKAANGWRAWPLSVESPGGGTVGARVLLRRPTGVPWTFAYAPRGPIAGRWDAASLAAFTESARASAGRPSGAGAGGFSHLRISHLRVDPEIEFDGPDDIGGATRQAFDALGWRPAP
ncbi:MAG: hypothetical protein ACRDGQ_06120, partial [Candidatus Limnocylindrales bacterium]